VPDHPSVLDPRGALVHDFFVAEGGGERVAIELARLLAAATVYTSFFDAARFGDRIDPARVRTWSLQRLTGPTSHFRAFLPLYPLYFSTLDLRGAGLVVSSSVAFSKAVRTGRRDLHVSYVHTPMRYAWDLDRYLGGSSYSLPARLAALSIRPVLQWWDHETARRPTVLVANSETVRGRILRLWGRDAEVIHPPVDVDEIAPSNEDDGYLLVLARLLAYRRIDLAVEACTRLGRELIVVGDGPDAVRLRRLAGPTVRFTGHLDRARAVELLRRCHAYLVPGVEDFGIAPVEAMAAGKPVVAFRSGGATETVVEGVTGVFFDAQTSQSLAEGIQRVDAMAVDLAAIRANAERFSTAVFRRRWRQLLEGLGVDRRLIAPD
jgi:glycosyltransferase involved in cell wall biosynthesis